VTPAAWVLLVVAAGAAALDWVAVACGRRRLEYVAKPAATLAILGVAATVSSPRPAAQAWFVAALGLSLAGDVFLMLGRNLFVAGLGSFLLAHLAYLPGLLEGSAGRWWVAVPVAVTACIVGVRLVRGLRRGGHGALVGPVLAYVAAIGTMVSAALASGNPAAGFGAVCFMVSDAMIGEQRFVRPRPAYPVAIMVTYHVAQASLALSLLR